MICKIWYFICQTMSGKLGTQTQPKYAPLCGLDCLMSGPCWHQINDSIELSSLHKGDMNPYGLGFAITWILHHLDEIPCKKFFARPISHMRSIGREGLKIPPSESLSIAGLFKGSQKACAERLSGGAR
jgi:hypothetical protein